MLTLRGFLRAAGTRQALLFAKLISRQGEINAPSCIVIQRGYQKRWTQEDCIPPPSFDDVTTDTTKRNLPILPKVPDEIPKGMRRNMRVIRGPCLGEEAELKLKQYGIIALKGGFIKHGHFEMMRMTINRGIRQKPYMCAQYRVPAVHKPVTRHPKNAVMGGGKGKIDHYVTPVKARQVIVEVAGKASYEEVFKFLKITAQNLPFPAIPVTYEKLQAMYDEERRIEVENENFITFREVVEKNMQGMRKYLTEYDRKQFGKYK